MSMTGEEVFRNFTGGNAGSLQAAADEVTGLAAGYREIAERFDAVQTRMMASWTGGASLAAFTGAGPLTPAMHHSADQLEAYASAHGAQTSAFDSAKASVVPVPPKPAAPGPLDLLKEVIKAGPAGAVEKVMDYRQGVAEHNAAAEHNLRVMNDYFWATSTNSEIPTDYPRPASSIDTIGTDTAGAHGTADQWHYDGGASGGGGGGQQYGGPSGSGGAAGVSGGAGGIGSTGLPGPGVPFAPGGGGTGPSAVLPPAVTGPSGTVPAAPPGGWGGTAPGPLPSPGPSPLPEPSPLPWPGGGGPSGGSPSRPIGSGPGGGAGSGGGSGSGGGRGTGDGDGSGGGAGAGGTGSDADRGQDDGTVAASSTPLTGGPGMAGGWATGGVASDRLPGTVLGVGGGTGGPDESSRVAGAGGSRYARGLGFLPHAGHARGEEDEEHNRPEYLIEPDPDAIFGSDERTSSPVIGENWKPE